VIFRQIWAFVAPGLYQHEKRLALPFTFLSSFCFLGGAAFGYYVVFPPAFKFLMGYSTDFLQATPTVKEYFSLALRLLIAFGVIFELPVAMVILAKIGVVDGPFLRKNRKYAFLLSFIIAAILTPTPDVVNQLLMAVPLVILYEIAIIAVALFGGTRLPGFEKGQGAGADDGQEKDGPPLPQKSA
jgi:sec-independent protein translocase protein TatC